MSAIATQPSLFMAHGDPMNAIRDNEFTRALAEVAAALPERPRAVLVVSAHWERPSSLACSASRPETIHDFGGFPDELYAVEYPAPGDPALAARVAALVPGCALTEDWGLDHGAWTVLRHMFPEAELPCLQLSIDRSAGLAGAFEIGRRLAPLRGEGVLVLGSGNVVHNLGAIRWGGEAFPWAVEFDAWVAARLAEGDHEALCDIARAGGSAREAARLSCPTLEHYAPLLYAMGAAAGTAARAPEPAFPYEGMEHASLSMRCVRWA
jgi:4,5-DOPA dioxygenase extradiol